MNSAVEAVGLSPPRGRKSNIYYKIESSVVTEVAVDNCLPFDIGTPWSPSSNAKRLSGSEQAGVFVKAAIARLSPRGDGGYEIITGLEYFDSVRTASDSDGAKSTLRVRIIDLTDEEAFSLAAAEIIKRGIYEVLPLAVALEKAHRLYYKYGFKWMASRLLVDPEWLKGFIELARLPQEVLSSFSDLSELDSEMILEMAHRLRNYRRRAVILARASILTAELAERKRLGYLTRSAKDVCWDLCNQRVSPRARLGKTEVRTRSGLLIACVTVKSPGVGSIEVYNPANVSIEERGTALQEALLILHQDNETEVVSSTGRSA